MKMVKRMTESPERSCCSVRYTENSVSFLQSEIAVQYIVFCEEGYVISIEKCRLPENTS